MLTFGVSQVGQYHLNAGSVVCQDAHGYLKIKDDLYIAVVSDGVGSQEHSEIASKAACESFINYFKEQWEKMNDLEKTLKFSFVNALYSTEDKYKELGMPMEDCTLCAVVWTPEYVLCGQAGDSGAIGLNEKGEYILLSDKKNDDEGRVYTLRFGEDWEFKRFDDRFVSILLATDGFYDYLFPNYMERYESYNPDKKITSLDYERTSNYMDLRVLEPKDQDDFTSKILARINSIPRKGNTWDAIDDDLTAVIIMDEKATVKVSDRFSKKLDTDRYRKEKVNGNRQTLYPSKKTIALGDTTYSVDLDLVNTCDRVVKTLSGNSAYIEHKKKDYNEFTAAELLAGGSNDLCLKPKDAVIGGDRITYVASIRPGMTTMSNYLPSRKRDKDELKSIADVFLKAVEQLHNTPFEPKAYDADSIFINIKGEILFDTCLERYREGSEKKPVKIAASVIKTLHFILSDSQKKFDKGDSAKYVLPEDIEDKVASIFGLEDMIAVNKEMGQTAKNDEDPVLEKKGDNDADVEKANPGTSEAGKTQKVNKQNTSSNTDKATADSKEDTKRASSDVSTKVNSSTGAEKSEQHKDTKGNKVVGKKDATTRGSKTKINWKFWKKD